MLLCAVFEADLSTIDLGSGSSGSGTVSLIKLGVSSGSTTSNDGLTCVETIVPFPTYVLTAHSLPECYACFNLLNGIDNVI